MTWWEMAIEGSELILTYDLDGDGHFVCAGLICQFHLIFARVTSLGLLQLNLAEFRSLREIDVVIFGKRLVVFLPAALWCGRAWKWVRSRLVKRGQGWTASMAMTMQQKWIWKEGIWIKIIHHDQNDKVLGTEHAWDNCYKSETCHSLNSCIARQTQEEQGSIIDLVIVTYGTQFAQKSMQYMHIGIPTDVVFMPWKQH